MVDFGYNNNAIRNQKHFKPIANGNVADSGMIALTDERLPFWKPKKEWKFKCKSWIKNSKINCCFSQNIAKHKLTVYLMYLCYLFFYLYKYLTDIGKLTGCFYDYINKKGYFYSHENITSYDIPQLARLSIPHYQNTWKVQCKLREVMLTYSLMLFCLKINCINIRAK